MHSVQRETYICLREDIVARFRVFRERSARKGYDYDWTSAAKAFHEVWLQVDWQVREPMGRLSAVASAVSSGLYNATWRDDEEISRNIRHSKTVPGVIANGFKSFKKKYLGWW